MDYDAIFDYGSDGEFINTINEIPRGSSLKIEYNRSKKAMVLDRVEPAIFAKPVNYGFIPRTTDDDGDPLDTLIVTDEPLPTGVAVQASVIGVLDFEDGGANDHKIICVPDDDRHNGDTLKSLADLPEAVKQQIVFHFDHYKDLKKPGTTKVRRWGDSDEAWKIIRDCASRYSQGLK